MGAPIPIKGRDVKKNLSYLLRLRFSRVWRREKKLLKSADVRRMQNQKTMNINNDYGNSKECVYGATCLWIIQYNSWQVKMVFSFRLNYEYWRVMIFKMTVHFWNLDRKHYHALYLLFLEYSKAMLISNYLFLSNLFDSGFFSEKIKSGLKNHLLKMNAICYSNLTSFPLKSQNWNLLWKHFPGTNYTNTAIFFVWIKRTV